jgi:hypothetical protein
MLRRRFLRHLNGPPGPVSPVLHSPGGHVTLPRWRVVAAGTGEVWENWTR